MNNQKEIAGLILSAGFSKRMGSFKPLLELNGTEFINVVTAKLRKVCEKTIIVTGHKGGQVVNSVNEKFSSEHDQKEKGKIIFVNNEDSARGMFSSLKLGVSQIESFDWVLYHFVDQPQIPQDFYTQFVDQVNDNYDWIQPVYEGKKGHPILFGKIVMQKILEKEEGNLKIISLDEKIRKKFWNCRFPETLKDFDRPEDLEPE